MPSEKIAITIPADILAGAERMARRLKKSRSQIIAAAVAEYVSRREPDAVTEAYNAVCDAAEEGDLERAVAAYSLRSLKVVEW